MAESWKGDAEGMLVFVSLCPTSHIFAYNIKNADRSILCCRRSVARGDHPRYSSEPAGHLSILSRNHLSATCPVEWHSNLHPILLVQPCRIIHTACLGRLGQWALVHELGHQHYLRRIGDVATAMGTSLSQSGLPTIQSPQASANSCILQEGCRGVAPSVGS